MTLKRPGKTNYQTTHPVNRTLISTLALFSFGGALLADETPAGKLLFSDQTSLTATPLAVDGEKKTIRLTSPSLDGEVSLKTDQLLEISIAGAPPKPADSDHCAVATIKPRFEQRPQDSIRGRLVALDDEFITLDTDYAGKLKLKRSMVQSLDIYGQMPTFYNGPGTSDGWTASNGNVEDAWEFRRRAMISRTRTGIARKVHIPERAKISFQVEWKSSPRFSFLFLSDDGETTRPDEGYALRFQATYASLTREGKDNPRNSNIFGETVRSLRKKTSATITIYLDRRKDGSNAVYFDKELISTWTQTDDTVLKGEWMHFVPQQVNPLRFSKISISQWDGNLPLAPNEKVDEKENRFGDELKGQKINLVNGDTVIGEIDGIKDGLVLLKTSFGKAAVPIRRMSTITLASEEDQPKMYPADVRAWFHEGGFVTLRLSSMDRKSIKGYSQVFDQAEFQLSAFSRIEFNIWSNKLDPDRYSPTRDWALPEDQGMEPPRRQLRKRLRR